MNKQKLVEAIVRELESELGIAVQAAKLAQEDATGEESRPENEYDTRALEASYVARGQAQRVTALKEAIVEYKNINLKKFYPQDPIVATALVEVDSQGKKLKIFFMPKGGGFAVTIDGSRIQVVTPSTPLGEALLNSKEGDVVSVELGNTEKEYKILRVE